VSKFVFKNKAATDLSAKDGYAAKYDTTGVNVCSAITDQAIGIITGGGDDTALQSEICVHGECMAIAGGTIKGGQMLTPHTDSTIVASAGSGCQEFALAMEDAVAGDWFKLFVLGAPKTHA